MGKQKRPKPLLEPVSEEGNSSFARALGSVDPNTREQGLRALTVFLSRKRDLPRLEFKKLWKGLFYCFWHADLAHVQEALATRLAEILTSVSDEVAAAYFETFLETMQREWFGIDRLRLDKFLMLVRKFVKQLFLHLQSTSWNEEVVARYTSFLLTIFEQSDDQTAAGLVFQLADVAIPELLAVANESQAQLPERAVRQLLDIFIVTMATTTRKSLPPRIRDSVFGPLVEELQSPSPAAPLQKLQTASLAQHIFDTGADPKVRVSNRALLYELSAELERFSNKKRTRPEDPKAKETAKRKKQQRQAATLTEDSTPAEAAAGTAEEAAAAKPGKQSSSEEDAGSGSRAQTPKQKKKKKRKSSAASDELGGIANGHSPEGTPVAAVRTSSQPSGGRNAAEGIARDSGVISAVPKRLRALAVGDGSPGSSEKHVKWALKRNLYFSKGGTVPEPSIRTPDSCKPKGSALKKVSKFPSPRSSPRAGSWTGPQKAKKGRKRSSLQPAALVDRLQSV